MLAACIEQNARTCDNVLCPADKVCNDVQGCVFPEQLTECAGIADGTACSYGMSIAGSCEGGVCLPLGCGNGIKTSDEVCDDGNNTNGDGCSADCHSLEVCGNGIVDLAKGEQCDDGNTDDLDACRNDCTLPHCNDGIVDPLEECDPSSPAPLTETCRDFGYYQGTLACSATCRFDPAGSCVGRCGDGIVQSAEGEECDGGLPAFSCVDDGFDYGAITCSIATCTADTAHSCGRFGWTHVHDIGLPIDLAADQNVIAIAANLNPGHELEIIEADGSWTTRAGVYVAVDVRAGTILAATAGTVEQRALGVWTTLPAPPLPTGDAIVAAVLASDGTPTILATSSSDCQVGQYDGTTWTLVPGPVGCTRVAGFGLGDFAVVAGTAVTWTYPGGATPFTSTTGGVVDIVRDGGVLDLYTFDDPSNVISKIVLHTTGPDTPTTFATGFDAQAGRPMYVIGAETYATQNASPPIEYLRAGYGRTEISTLPPLTLGALYRSHDGKLLTTGIVASSTSTGYGLYTRAPYAEALRTGPPGIANGSATAIALDGTLLACDGANLYTSSGAGWTAIPYTTATGTCSRVWGRSASDIYIVRQTPGARLWHWDGAGWTSSFAFTFVSGDASEVAAILVTDASIWRLVAGSWIGVTMPTGCGAYAFQIVGGRFYVTGYCATTFKVWRTDLATWTELDSVDASDPNARPQALYVSPDGVVFVALADDRVVILDGPTRQVFPSIGLQLAGTGSTDVYALFPGQLHPLQRWDGARWSPVRADPSLNYRQLAATASDLVLLAAGQQWVGLLRTQ